MIPEMRELLSVSTSIERLYTYIQYMCMYGIWLNVSVYGHTSAGIWFVAWPQTKLEFKDCISMGLLGFGFFYEKKNTSPSPPPLVELFW